jgi:hypothetical protein
MRSSSSQVVENSLSYQESPWLSSECHKKLRAFFVKPPALACFEDQIGRTLKSSLAPESCAWLVVSTLLIFYIQRG